MGALLILMFLGFLPVNVYAAVERIDFGGHGMGPVYLLTRVPFQLLLVAWTCWGTGQQWPLGRRVREPGRSGGVVAGSTP